MHIKLRVPMDLIHEINESLIKSSRACVTYCFEEISTPKSEFDKRLESVMADAGLTLTPRFKQRNRLDYKLSDELMNECYKFYSDRKYLNEVIVDSKLPEIVSQELLDFIKKQALFSVVNNNVSIYDFSGFRVTHKAIVEADYIRHEVSIAHK